MPLVLICIAQETEKDALVVEDAVRAVHPDAGAVLVAHVIDLHKVPGLFRKVAEGMLASEFRKAAEALRDGQDAYGYVVMLPDWQGEVAPALDLPDPSTTVCGVVIAGGGEVLGTYTGSDGGTVLALLDGALAH
jgi:hypothetical protein